MMNIFKNRPFSINGLLAVPILFFTIIMGSYFPKIAPDEGFKSFILAFEFAQTPEETNSLFENLSEETIKNINTGIYIDYGFMVVYSLFLMLFFIKSTQISNVKWLLGGIPLTIVIFLGDFFENIFLLKITHIYSSGLNKTMLESILQDLNIITWIKWEGLAIAFLMISIYLFKGKWLSKIGAIFCILPFLLSFIALNNSPFVLSLFTLSIFVGFGVLIFYSFLFRKPIV